MPRFFDDYSNTYLTHDSAAGRKQQRRGWKFRENFKLHYEKKLDEWRAGPMGLAAAQQAFLRTQRSGSVGPLPAGWIEELDQATGINFYIHEESQRRTWVRPGFRPPPVGMGPRGPMMPPSMGMGAPPGGGPPGFGPPPNMNRHAHPPPMRHPQNPNGNLPPPPPPFDAGGAGGPPPPPWNVNGPPPPPHSFPGAPPPGLGQGPPPPYHLPPPGAGPRISSTDQPPPAGPPPNQ